MHDTSPLQKQIEMLRKLVCGGLKIFFFGSKSVLLRSTLER